MGFVPLFLPQTNSYAHCNKSWVNQTPSNRGRRAWWWYSWYGGYRTKVYKTPKGQEEDIKNKNLEWKKCANEGGVCKLPGYSENKCYRGGSSCPNYYGCKSRGKCDCTRFGGYDSRCKASGKANGGGLVRYGSGNKWTMRGFEYGYPTCNNSTFGDPVPGVGKRCEYKKY